MKMVRQHEVVKLLTEGVTEILKLEDEIPKHAMLILSDEAFRESLVLANLIPVHASRVLLDELFGEFLTFTNHIPIVFRLLVGDKVAWTVPIVGRRREKMLFVSIDERD